MRSKTVRSATFSQNQSYTFSESTVKDIVLSENRLSVRAQWIRISKETSNDEDSSIALSITRSHILAYIIWLLFQPRRPSPAADSGSHPCWREIQSSPMFPSSGNTLLFISSHFSQRWSRAQVPRRCSFSPARRFHSLNTLSQHSRVCPHQPRFWESTDAVPRRKTSSMLERTRRLGSNQGPAQFFWPRAEVDLRMVRKWRVVLGACKCLLDFPPSVRPQRTAESPDRNGVKLPPNSCASHQNRSGEVVVTGRKCNRKSFATLCGWIRPPSWKWSLRCALWAARNPEKSESKRSFVLACSWYPGDYQQSSWNGKPHADQLISDICFYFRWITINTERNPLSLCNIILQSLNRIAFVLRFIDRIQLNAFRIFLNFSKSSNECFRVIALPL